jgi:tetratricopeptide (TPR) repeat protein
VSQSPSEEKPPEPEQPSTPERSPEEEAALVNQALKDAKKLLAEQKYWDVIQVLEGALPLTEASQRQRHRVQVLLAQAVVKNPKWKKRAEDLLQKVVSEDPKNVDAHLQLGLLYKEGGLKSRSERMLRKVLELDPSNQEARAALGIDDPSLKSRTLLDRLRGSE